MAFMLSARSAPDQKHALEPPWDGWVLLISVVDRFLHDLPLALSNLVKRADMALIPMLLWHGFPVRAAACHQDPGDPRHLVGQSNCGDLRRAPLQQLEQPRATRAVSLCVTERCCAGLDADQARPELGKEDRYLGTPKAAAENLPT